MPALLLPQKLQEARPKKLSGGDAVQAGPGVVPNTIWEHFFIVMNRMRQQRTAAGAKKISRPEDGSVWSSPAPTNVSRDFQHFVVSGSTRSVPAQHISGFG